MESVFMIALLVAMEINVAAFVLPTFVPSVSGTVCTVTRALASCRPAGKAINDV